MKTGLQIAKLAKDQLTELTHMKSDTVSALFKDDQGWHVVLEMLEMKRIPESTDMLASYDTLLDEEGNMIKYHRVRRYLRAQLLESED